MVVCFWRDRILNENSGRPNYGNCFSNCRKWENNYSTDQFGSNNYNSSVAGSLEE